jgi:uncharacterized membrane protein
MSPGAVGTDADRSQGGSVEPVRPASTHRVTSARTKLSVSVTAAVLAGTVAAALGTDRDAPLIGWDILAIVFCGWVWSSIWRLDPASTASHAQRENTGRDLADLVLLGAAAASLIAVAVVLSGAGHAHGMVKYWQAGLGGLAVPKTGLTPAPNRLSLGARRGSHARLTESAVTRLRR